MIRGYEPARDRDQLRACVIELQEFERGLGRALLEQAEGFARGAGAGLLRVSVLARNEGARRLYARMGFADYTVQLSKPLR